MGKFEQLISSRLKRKDDSPKMAALAKQSASGHLTSFAGIFGMSELNETEKTFLEEILNRYARSDADVNEDLKSLISITSEVKAINNQAAILHGERIKRAQVILKRYEDGAFSSWLMAAYGNRQTPYNFLQYFEFYEAMPKELRPQIESMPRQAVYTLASREGPLKEKQIIVEKYNGQTKQQLIEMIRESFPLALEDKRQQDIGDNAIQSLKRLCALLCKRSARVSQSQKGEIEELLQALRSHLQQCKVK
jgi:hypothetical protein